MGIRFRITTRPSSTSKSTSVPVSMPRASRTLLGSVTCPLLVTVGMAPSLPMESYVDCTTAQVMQQAHGDCNRLGPSPFLDYLLNRQHPIVDIGSIGSGPPSNSSWA
jgi:hypothetical protein